MTPETAYAIGLFEGEGSVIVPQRGQLRMCMSMTDKGPLDRLVKTWGGKVYGPYTYGPLSRKPIYQWQLAGWERIAEIFEEICPWLSERRANQFGACFRSVSRARRQGVHYNTRKTQCRNGHPYNNQNTRTSATTGERVCRVCRRDQARERRRVRAK